MRHHRCMAIGGTARYETQADLPPRVASAVAAARHDAFSASCLPEQGRLLQLLAAGVGAGRIAETGTGYGVGLAWMASMAHPDARLFSIEGDQHRARRAQQVFADDPRVQVRCGQDLARDAPFDPQLRTTEIRVTPTAASLIATYIG